MSRSLRSGLALGLVALGGLATFASAAAGYASRVLADRDGFAETVTEAVGCVVSPASTSDALANLAGKINGVAS
jgi:hypothetical protein